jgi:hypothetical protein
MRPHRLGQRLADLVAVDGEGLGHPADQVAALDLHRLDLAGAGGVADLLLDVLGGAVADQQVVLALDEADDGVVHLVARHPDRAGGHDPAREMTATSVVPPPMSTTMLPEGSVTGRPGADRRRHRLLDQVDLRAPAARAESRTARFSTSVMPEGTPMMIRGLTRVCRLWPG